MPGRAWLLLALLGAGMMADAPGAPRKRREPPGPEGMSAVIGGKFLRGILRVRITARGRVGVVHSLGVLSVDVEEVSDAFLARWGITVARRQEGREPGAIPAPPPLVTSDGTVDSDAEWMELWSDFPVATAGAVIRAPGRFSGNMAQVTGTLRAAERTAGSGWLELEGDGGALRVRCGGFLSAAESSRGLAARAEGLFGAPPLGRAMRVVVDVTESGAGPPVCELVDFRVE